jgi:type IV pilus assembly protein PilO
MTRTRKWSLLSALLVVMVLLAGWFLLVSPKRSSAADLRTQTASQESRNNDLNAQIADLQAKQKNLPQQQAIIAQIQQEIPQNPELPALVRSISSMATSAGVDVHTITPVIPSASSAVQPPNAVGVNGETLQVINVQMEVDGSYFNIERFLNKMENLKRALLVTGITLNVNSGTGTTGGSTIVASQAGVSPGLAAIVTFRAFMVSSAAAPGSSPLHTATTTGTTGTTGGTSSTTSSSTPAQ